MVKHRFILILLSAFLAVFLLYGCGQIQELEAVKDSKATDGPTVFVDADFEGTESNGTQQFPYTTIQAAIDAARSGQTVFVKSMVDPLSVYKERLIINKNVNLQGDGNTKIEVELAAGDPVLIRGMIIFDGAEACGSISGFEISHSDFNDGSGIICKNGAAPNIHGNKIWSNLNGVLIMYGAHPTIENNNFDDNEYAVYINGSAENYTNIYNNKIMNSRDPLDFENWSAIVMDSGSRANICNNTFFQNTRAIYFCQSNSIGNINNNIFVDNRAGSFSTVCYLASSRCTANIYNNIFDNNKKGIVASATGTVYLHYNSFSRNDTDYNSFVTNTSNIFAIIPQYTDTMNYTVTNISAFAEKGSPSSNFNDRNGSRCDLGVFGGPNSLN